MSNLNKDTEHTNGGGTVEEEVGAGELRAAPALGHRRGRKRGWGWVGTAEGPGTGRRGWNAGVSGDGGWSAASSGNRGWGTGDGAGRYRGPRRRHRGVGGAGKERSASFGE